MSAAAPRFHRLAVNDLRRETADAVSMTFSIPSDLADDYAFAPGQYLTLRTTMDGEEVRRSYSICSGPDDGELRIAVKKVDGGAFSSWAADELKAGDELGFGFGQIERHAVGLGESGDQKDDEAQNLRHRSLEDVPAGEESEVKAALRLNDLAQA